MINVFVVNGKVLEKPEMKETPNGTKHTTLLLNVERGFRNSEGIYEYDQIAVEIWRSSAETVVDHCKVGDMMGIKGRIQSRVYQSQEGNSFINYDLIAEKVDFLSYK